MQPRIATNREGERVADQVSGYLGGLRAQWAEPPTVSIATAFFNPGGFVLLADELEATGPVRLLLGAEPQAEPVPSQAMAISGLAARRSRRRPAISLISSRTSLGSPSRLTASTWRLVPSGVWCVAVSASVLA